MSFPRAVRNRGRHPRNPIEALRTLVLMQAICIAAKIRLKGYQLETHFEPEKIIKKSDGTYKRGCKWDRYINGKASPSRQTLALIFKKYPAPQFKELYNSPLWVAMKAGELSTQYWLNFYHSLRFSLQKLMIKPTANNVLKKPRHSTIDAILRQGDLQALACLISIIRNSSLRVSLDVKHHAEIATNNLLLWTFINRTFSPFVGIFWQYIRQHILTENHPLFDTTELWNQPLDVISQYLFSLNSIVLRAEDVGLIDYSEKQTTEFLFWLYKGDTNLIVDEITNARRVKHYTLVDNHKGLKWLIGKINKMRGERNQIGDVL